MEMDNEEYNDDSFMCSLTVPPPPNHSCFFEDENIGDRTTAVAVAAENALAYAIPNNHNNLFLTENRYHRQGIANEDEISSIASAINEAILEHRQDSQQSLRPFHSNSNSASAHLHTSIQNSNEICSDFEFVSNYESYTKQSPQEISSNNAETKEDVIESKAEFVVNPSNDYPFRQDDNNCANTNSHQTGIFVRTRDNVDNKKRAKKKPFLKKGSRKEPSSLNRIKAESSTNQYVDNDSNPSNKKYELIKKENLQKLEKMQKHQLNMLQKRNERRLSYFPPQQQTKKVQEKQRSQNLQNTHKMESKIKMSTVTPKKESSKTSNSKSNRGQIEEHESKISTCESKEGKCEELLQNNASTLKSNNSQQNKCKRYGVQAAKTEWENSDIATKLMEEKKAFASQMKSMKKRQEAALLEAEQTRESVSFYVTVIK